MKSLVLTRQAEVDLTEIWDYIARDNFDTADRVIDEIREAMHKLAEMPDMGHVREDLAARCYRFWPVYSYLIVYRADVRPLQIIRVISGYRNVLDILG